MRPVLLDGLGALPVDLRCIQLQRVGAVDVNFVGQLLNSSGRAIAGGSFAGTVTSTAQSLRAVTGLSATIWAPTDGYWKPHSVVYRCDGQMYMGFGRLLDDSNDHEALDPTKAIILEITNNGVMGGHA